MIGKIDKIHNWAMWPRAQFCCSENFYFYVFYALFRQIYSNYMTIILTMNEFCIKDYTKLHQHINHIAK